MAVQFWPTARLTRTPQTLRESCWLVREADRSTGSPRIPTFPESLLIPKMQQSMLLNANAILNIQNIWRLIQSRCFPFLKRVYIKFHCLINYNWHKFGTSLILIPYYDWTIYLFCFSKLYYIHIVKKTDMTKTLLGNFKKLQEAAICESTVKPRNSER